MVAITPQEDRPGLLAEILQIVANHNLNNAKIHSRPALDNVAMNEIEPQMFYLEIMAHERQENFNTCIEALKSMLVTSTGVVRILGSYGMP